MICSNLFHIKVLQLHRSSKSFSLIYSCLKKETTERAMYDFLREIFLRQKGKSGTTFK